MGDFRASLDQDDVKAGERTAEFGHFVNLSHIEIWGDHSLGARAGDVLLCGHQFGHFYGILYPHHSVESLVKSLCY